MEIGDTVYFVFNTTAVCGSLIPTFHLRKKKFQRKIKTLKKRERVYFQKEKFSKRKKTIHEKRIPIHLKSFLCILKKKNIHSKVEKVKNLTNPLFTSLTQTQMMTCSIQCLIAAFQRN